VLVRSTVNGPGFNLKAHRSTMPQINMIPHPGHFKLTMGQPDLLKPLNGER